MLESLQESGDQARCWTTGLNAGAGPGAKQQTVPMVTSARSQWSLPATTGIMGTEGQRDTGSLLTRRLRNSWRIPIICLFLEELALCSEGGRGKQQRLNMVEAPPKWHVGPCHSVT